MAAAAAESGSNGPPFKLANSRARLGSSRGNTVTPTIAGAVTVE
jgi:hypothetical protein